MKKKRIMIAITITMVAVILTVLILGGTKTVENNLECCQKICGEFNQECRGWVTDTLECTFNYGQYGFPEVDEVFVFKINDSMIERVCNAPETEPINEEDLNLTQ